MVGVVYKAKQQEEAASVPGLLYCFLQFQTAKQPRRSLILLCSDKRDGFARRPDIVDESDRLSDRQQSVILF